MEQVLHVTLSFKLSMKFPFQSFWYCIQRSDLLMDVQGKNKNITGCTVVKMKNVLSRGMNQRTKLTL